MKCSKLFSLNISNNMKLDIPDFSNIKHYTNKKMVYDANEDKYIKCSCCKSNYINDNETTVKMFGYNRVQKRYQTCLTCRAKKKKPPAH